MQISKWRAKEGESPTHVLMNGGQLFVPDTDAEAFWRAYLADLASGAKLYVVEQKTEIFRFFVDVDYKSAKALSDDEALEICRNIHEAVGGDRTPCLVARAPPREEKGLVKSGMHIHWPDLLVEKNEALSLRTQILLTLEDDHWSETIDASVYRGSGLRFLWSLKKGVRSSYVPWKSIPDGKNLDPTPRLDSLRLFSIRGAQGQRARATPGVPAGDLEQFIQKNMQGQGNARVKAIRRTKKGEGKGFYVETDSKWCERIQGEHKSNHVWFYINGRNITQKCLDEDCIEFSGREHFLPPSISNEPVCMDSPARPRLGDLLPTTWRGTFSGIRKQSSSVLGSGSERMEVVREGTP